jgi:hypothetical protein
VKNRQNRKARVLELSQTFCGNPNGSVLAAYSLPREDGKPLIGVGVLAPLAALNAAG